MFWYVSLRSVKISACYRHPDGGYYSFRHVKCGEKKKEKIVWKCQPSHRHRTTGRLCKDASFLNLHPAIWKLWQYLRKNYFYFGLSICTHYSVEEHFFFRVDIIRFKKIPSQGTLLRTHLTDSALVILCRVLEQRKSTVMWVLISTNKMNFLCM